MAERFCSVATSRAVTVAPGRMAPLGSVIVPAISAVFICPSAGLPRSKIKHETKANERPLVPVTDLGTPMALRERRFIFIPSFLFKKNYLKGYLDKTHPKVESSWAMLTLALRLLLPSDLF